MSLPWVFALLLVAMAVWYGGRTLLHKGGQARLRKAIDDHPKAVAIVLITPVVALFVLGALALLGAFSQQ